MRVAGFAQQLKYSRIPSGPEVLRLVWPPDPIGSSRQHDQGELSLCASAHPAQSGRRNLGLGYLVALVS